MRDRIYKAKRKNWKELPKEKWWVYGAIFEGKENSYIITNVKITDEWEDSEIGADVIGYLIDAETTCEPTGLTDKNGRKIFEGDIVSAPFTGYAGKTKIKNGVVEFVKGAFSVNWNDSEEYGKNFAGYVNDIEVIGNIFDNHDRIGENDG